MDGSARPEYPARGTVYVEALSGRDFSLRITNPLGVRVAVALSVDGLNTIDAKHTTAQEARKWILDPYQTVVIPGWQVSGDTSRKFYFTGEKRSYGARWARRRTSGRSRRCSSGRSCRTAWALVGREKGEKRRFLRMKERGERRREDCSNENQARLDAPEAAAHSAAGAPAGAKQAQNEPSDAARDHSKKSPSSSSSSLSDDLAATGIGRRTRFEVTHVDLDLEDSPAMSVAHPLRVPPAARRPRRPARDPRSDRPARGRARIFGLLPRAELNSKHFGLSSVCVRDRFRLRRRALHAPLRDPCCPRPPRPRGDPRKRRIRETRLTRRRRHPPLPGHGEDPPERPEGHRRPDRLPEHRLAPDPREDGLAERGRARQVRLRPFLRAHDVPRHEGLPAGEVPGDRHALGRPPERVHDGRLHELPHDVPEGRPRDDAEDRGRPLPEPRVRRVGVQDRGARRPRRVQQEQREPDLRSSSR